MTVWKHMTHANCDTQCIHVFIYVFKKSWKSWKIERKWNIRIWSTGFDFDFDATYLFIHWNVFLLASFSIMKSQQRNSYSVQFLQQVREIYRKQKRNNELSWRSKEKWFEMFLTVSKLQFINLERSASGIVFHNVGPASFKIRWSVAEPFHPWCCG